MHKTTAEYLTNGKESDKIATCEYDFSSGGFRGFICKLHGYTFSTSCQLQ